MSEVIIVLAVKPTNYVLDLLCSYISNFKKKFDGEFGLALWLYEFIRAVFIE